MATSIFPVILCGGSGTRLWPVSRRSYPKQFCPLLKGGSLFQRTLTRLGQDKFAPPIVVTHNDFRFIAAEQMGDVGFEATRLMLEPDGRNTAPAICLAALEVMRTDPNGLLLVLPSDHLVNDVDAFHRALDAGREAAEAGALVTFGIAPDRPETGYGYIEKTDAGSAAPQPFKCFVEKPNAERAAEMLASGAFLWNAGIFMFSAKDVLAAFDAHAPEVRAATEKSLNEGQSDLDFFRPDAEAYLSNPNISIDYAIMEHAEGVVVPVDCGWNDLGSWETIWRESGPDGDGVASVGDAIAIDCQNSLLRTDNSKVRLVGIGLDNVVAVATGDAVLVSTMDRSQDVRDAVDQLKAAGADQAEQFPRDYRPWGWFEQIAEGNRFQVKQIMVKPGGLLSLQSHHHRSEHWIVVAGTAQVTVGEETRLMAENESVYIPLGEIHRLHNPGKVDLHLIEVQSGPYLGEDDIVRYADAYARD